MDIYWLWLTALKGVGPVTQRNLVKEFGSPQAVYLILSMHKMENIIYETVRKR